MKKETAKCDHDFYVVEFWELLNYAIGVAKIQCTKCDMEPFFDNAIFINKG